MLEGAETARFWDITLPPMRRGAFRWKRLLDAPVIALPLADPRAYIDRYSEPDKKATGLGAGTDAWPAPYWTVDASMSVMTMLLAAEALGLGALFFGVFQRRAPAAPGARHPAGDAGARRIALGWPADVVDPTGGGRRHRPRRSRPLGATHAAARPTRSSTAARWRVPTGRP